MCLTLVSHSFLSHRTARKSDEKEQANQEEYIYVCTHIYIYTHWVGLSLVNELIFSPSGINDVNITDSVSNFAHDSILRPSHVRAE